MKKDESAKLERSQSWRWCCYNYENNVLNMMASGLVEVFTSILSVYP